MRKALVVSIFVVNLICSLAWATEPKFLTLPMEETPVFWNSFADHSGWIKNASTGRGIDYGMSIGTNIVAAADGTIKIVKKDLSNLSVDEDSTSGGYGNYIKIDHGEIDGSAWTTFYGHLSPNVLVQEDEKVSAGQVIAQSGHNGFSTAPHLHFEVRKDNVNVDPYDGEPSDMGTNHLWTTNPPSHGYTLTATTFTSNHSDFNVNKGETLIVDCTLENKSTDEVMNVDQIAISVHDKDGNILTPAVETIYNNGGLGWKLLQPGEPIIFPSTSVNIASLAVGEYKLIVKAKIDGGWKHLHEEVLTIRKKIYTDIQLKSVDPETNTSTVDDLSITLTLNSKTGLSKQNGTWGADYGKSLSASFRIENTGGSDVDIQELALAVHHSDGTIDNIGGISDNGGLGWKLKVGSKATLSQRTITGLSDGEYQLAAKAYTDGGWKNLHTRKIIVSDDNIWVETQLTTLDTGATITSLVDLVLSISLDPGKEQGKAADWFLMALYEGEGYNCVHVDDNGTLKLTWEKIDWDKIDPKNGLPPLMQASLGELEDYELSLGTITLHPDWDTGEFRFYFGVDNNPDWKFDGGQYLFFAGGTKVEITGVTPTAGLLAYYSFSGNPNDTSGNDNHGSVQGATLVKDRSGNTDSAYYFDGNDTISIPNLINGLSELTISAWFNYSDSDSWRWIYGNHPDLVDIGVAVKKGENVLRYHFATDEDFQSGDGSTGLNPDEWYHLALVYNGTQVRGYLNSQLDFLANISGTVTASATQSIGAGCTNTADGCSSDEYFMGSIDDVQIYDKALSSAEIQDLSGITVSTNDVTGTWLEKLTGNIYSSEEFELLQDIDGNITGTFTITSSVIGCCGPIYLVADVSGYIAGNSVSLSGIVTSSDKECSCASGGWINLGSDVGDNFGWNLELSGDQLIRESTSCGMTEIDNQTGEETCTFPRYKFTKQ